MISVRQLHVTFSTCLYWIRQLWRHDLNLNIMEMFHSDYWRKIHNFLCVLTAWSLSLLSHRSGSHRWVTRCKQTKACFSSLYSWPPEACLSLYYPIVICTLHKKGCDSFICQPIFLTYLLNVGSSTWSGSWAPIPRDTSQLIEQLPSLFFWVRCGPSELGVSTGILGGRSIVSRSAYNSIHYSSTHFFSGD